MSNKFQISDTMFSKFTVLFQMRNIFSAYSGDSSISVTLTKRTHSVVTVAYTTPRSRINVLWHCNDVEYPLGGKYFFKKAVPNFEK